jgi:hypothetical protein
MSDIGFVVLSHDNPKQLLRLTERLLRSFRGCSIVCHHDLERCPISLAQFPAGVAFVQPPLWTFWGHISLVQAELRALEMLYEKANPEWFAILSGSDYPIAPGSKILGDLSRSEYDALLDHRLISNGNCSSTVAIHNNENWHAYACRRYLQTTLSPAVLNSVLGAETIGQVDHAIRNNAAALLVPSVRPFPPTLSCFAGDHWLTGNRRIAHCLLEDSTLRKTVLDYFAECIVPDEAVYQTILCNTPSILVSAENKRYSEWLPDGVHPQFLGCDRLSDMLNSGAHFARKFREEDGVLEMLDEIIDDESSKAGKRTRETETQPLTL